ncbi:hypothetical protein [Planomonospora parontospora]|uniref:hypothetical protein n=1 Tax=Planomonospora parontospora TaxID=58119 RepID=UPI0016708091|nr:hypothetical protein [Planomonospora parontospora]GGL42609.1 hypothetical protein GCM10014719_49900 [Planomonospora parontospora subsp. antibiotica]GII18371.1 hypothetical protein Ppa05_50970 [Planomonospora parontospora subsp. antibiotica]
MPHTDRSTLTADSTTRSSFVSTSHPNDGSSLPLDVAEKAFRLLVAGPRPLAVDGAVLGHGLPARAIPVDELRAILLHPSCGRTTRDEVWRHLITHARTHRGAWMVAAVAVAMPLLRRLTKTLSETLRMEREDLEAEVLTCFMEALERVNLAWTHPLLRLARLTQCAVLRTHPDREPQAAAEPDLAGQPLSCPDGHVDLLLAGAIRQGILTADMAQILGVTRLENIPLSLYCRREGLDYVTTRKRRQRAEARLVAALISGELSSF